MSPLWLLLGCQNDSIQLDSLVKTPPTDSEADSSDTLEPLPSLFWIRNEISAPSSVTITEIFYNNPENPDAEWIELYNPMAYDLDLSGWQLSGGISYTFPEATHIPAQSYQVIAADPTRIAGSLGPYSGQLSNSGERINLISNGGRRIDTIAWQEDSPWPVAADGSGHTLAKIRPTLASDHAENWIFSLEYGGTPGAANAVDPDAPPTQAELLALESYLALRRSGKLPSRLLV
jgi:hypothetical protein